MFWRRRPVPEEVSPWEHSEPPPPAAEPAPEVTERAWDEDIPPFGWHGERLPRAEPPPPPPPVFAPPPPDWQSENLSIVTPPPAPPEEPKGLTIEPPPWAADFVPGPPARLEPLQRFQIPEVDWAQEEREQAARERAERAEEIEPIESHISYPAAKKRRSA